MNRLLPPPTGAVRLLLATAVLISLTLTGCATQRGVAVYKYEFFALSEPATDPWHDQVAEWQERARKDHPTVSIEPPTDQPPFKRRSILSRQQLRTLIGEFEVEQRHELARRISKWAWLTGRFYYVPDEGEESADVPDGGEASADEDGDGDEDLTTMGDYWPTYSELVDANSSDCDGLDLLAYQLLREFGFPKDQLFRAILRRHRDNANHMVTLWFEDPGDPWVFDATGAATRELVRFSEVQGWTPTNVFNETAQYTVVERNAASPRSEGHPFAALSPGLSPP